MPPKTYLYVLLLAVLFTSCRHDTGVKTQGDIDKEYFSKIGIPYQEGNENVLIEPTPDYDRFRLKGPYHYYWESSKRGHQLDWVRMAPDQYRLTTNLSDTVYEFAFPDRPKPVQVVKVIGEQRLYSERNSETFVYESGCDEGENCDNMAALGLLLKVSSDRADRIDRKKLPSR